MTAYPQTFQRFMTQENARFPRSGSRTKLATAVLSLAVFAGCSGVGLMLASSAAAEPWGRPMIQASVERFCPTPKCKTVSPESKPAAPHLVADVLSVLGAEAHRSRLSQPRLVEVTPTPRLDRREIESLARRCAPATPVSVVASIVAVESGGRPLILLRNGTRRQRFEPSTREMAEARLDALQAENASVDVGLMQLNTVTLRHLHVPVAAALDACTNIRLGARVFDAAYASAFARRARTVLLLSAYSAYNTGDLDQGLANGYADRALHNLRIPTPSRDPS